VISKIKKKQTKNQVISTGSIVWQYEEFLEKEEITVGWWSQKMFHIRGRSELAFEGWVKFRLVRKERGISLKRKRKSKSKTTVMSNVYVEEI